VYTPHPHSIGGDAMGGEQFVKLASLYMTACVQATLTFFAGATLDLQ